MLRFHKVTESSKVGTFLRHSVCVFHSFNAVVFAGRLAESNVTRRKTYIIHIMLLLVRLRA